LNNELCNNIHLGYIPIIISVPGYDGNHFSMIFLDGEKGEDRLTLMIQFVYVAAFKILVYTKGDSISSQIKK